MSHEIKKKHTHTYTKYRDPVSYTVKQEFRIIDTAEYSMAHCQPENILLPSLFSSKCWYL